jgi:hypothetical protein
MNKDRERNVFQDASRRRGQAASRRECFSGYEAQAAFGSRGLSGPRSNHAPGRAGAIRGRAADWRGGQRQLQQPPRGRQTRSGPSAALTGRQAGARLGRYSAASLARHCLLAPDQHQAKRAATLAIPEQYPSKLQGARPGTGVRARSARGGRVPCCRLPRSAQGVSVPTVHVRSTFCGRP